MDRNSCIEFETLQNIGDCYANTGRVNDARLCYERAAELAPDSAEPYIGLGRIAMQCGDYENADIAFSVAARLDGDTSCAYAGMAKIAYLKNDFKRAFDMYLKSLEKNADNFESLLGLFQTSCKMGSFARVIQYLDIYMKNHPADSSVMFCLAALHVREERFGQAGNLLEEVVRLEPQNADAAALLEEVRHRIAENIQNIERVK